MTKISNQVRGAWERIPEIKAPKANSFSQNINVPKNGNVSTLISIQPDQSTPYFKDLEHEHNSMTSKR